MAGEVAATIAIGVSSLVAALFQAFKAHEAAMPVKKKRSLCTNLVKLRQVLTDVIETGKEIGEYTGARGLAPPGSANLNRLVDLTTRQIDNLNAANSLASKLSAFFDIDAPKFNELAIYITGKSRRIGIIYDVAVKAGNPPWVRNSLNQDEMALIFTDPRKLIVEMEMNRGGTWRLDKPRAHYDEDFDQLSKSIRPLTQLIKKVCPAEYRS